MQQSLVPALKILVFFHEGGENGGLLSHSLFQSLDLIGGVVDAGGGWASYWGCVVKKGKGYFSTISSYSCPSSHFSCSSILLQAHVPVLANPLDMPHLGTVTTLLVFYVAVPLDMVWTSTTKAPSFHLF